MQLVCSNFVGALALCWMVFCSTTVYGAIPMPADQYIVGKHYKVVDSKIRSHPEVKQLLAEDPNKIQVIMFFNYGCYWCSQLDHAFDEWSEKQPSDMVVIKKIPVIFNSSWETLAKIYYAIQTLDQAKQLDDEIFTAIHQHRVNLASIKTLEAFLEKRDVDTAKFRQTLESFSVGRKVKRAEELGLAFDVTKTPLIIINSPSASYETSWAMTGSKLRLFAILDYLVKQEVMDIKNKKKS